MSEAAVTETAHVDPDRARLARLMDFLRGLLVRPHALASVIGLALALHAVSLGIDLTADDHFHAVALREDLVSPGMERAAWDQFAFAKSPQGNRALVEEGAFPWWTDPELVIAFFRPISSLTLWLDHTLWPHSPWLMHLHSLVWFAALLGAVWAVLRELIPQRSLALLALLLYALDDARSMPVGWLANRNALVALAPGFLALALHARARRTKRALLLALAPLCFLVGLLGGEPALPVLGYLFAYALFLDEGTLKSRALSLVPYAGLVVAWRLFYNGLGYGALQSGIYLDPGREPLAFAGALMERLPILLLSQFALPPSDLWEAYPLIDARLQPFALVFAALVLSALAWLLWPLLRREATLRFWACGALLATIPVCGTHPEDRVLTATSLGGAVVVARALTAFAEGTGFRPRAAEQATAYGLLAIHLFVAPLFLPLRTLGIVSMEVSMVASDESIPRGPEAAQQTVVLMNPPVDLFAVYLPAFRLSRGIQGPGHLRWLATGESALHIERPDANTLAVTPADGFLATSSQQMFRRIERSPRVGDQVHLEGLTLQVTRSLPDGRPATVHARFDANLDDENFRWLRWEHHRYVPFEVPKVGEAIDLAAVDLRELLFD